MQCELCGREVEKLLPVKVEGVEMLVCSNCAKYGVTPKTYSRKPKLGKKSIPRGSRGRRVYRPKRDVFDSLKTIVEDYGEIIREGRIKRGMSIEELARRVGIRVSTLHKIESGQLEPEEKYIRRLEKELNISLYEEGGEGHDSQGTGGTS
ncbi:MAG TPA: TIGR00270 family protein [Methanothermococcus okinawensis]|uniref:TIGR00270 family protein n=1 Tax=Methanothermococcus okinawensis TaxID=155863 RepID=A0A833E1I7_9EURY|nr:TIGR00270 family protein [Methanothermococcus okinawensis]HIP91795.1 TIGR00270 family protein [Methanothermococcus okinawensis]